MKKLGKMLVMLLVVIFGGLTILSGCFKDPSKGKEKIVFWTPPFVEVQTREWFTRWTDKFNETNTDNIYIDINFIPEDVWEQRLTAARDNGTAPDLIFANYAKIPLEGRAGYHRDLNEYFTDEEWADVYENIESMINVQGARYIYPAFFEPYSILYYSKSKFTDAGLDPNRPPETWAQLIDYSQKLTNNKTGSEKVYGIQLPPAGQLGWALWGFQGMAGTELLNDNWDTAVYDTEFNRGLFEMFRAIYKGGYSPKTSAYSYTEINQLANGRVAMQPCGSWAIGQLKNDFPNKFSDIGIAKFPTPNGEDNISTAAMGGWGMTISADCKKPELAIKFLKYLLAGDEEIMLDFFKGLGYSKFTARKSVDNKLNTMEETKNDEMRKYISENINPWVVPEPCYPWSISDAFAIKLQEYMLQDKSLDSVMSSLGSQLNGYIKSEETANKNPRKTMA